MFDPTRERRSLSTPRRLAQHLARVAVTAAMCTMLGGVQQAQAYSPTIKRPWGLAQVGGDRKAAFSCDRLEDNRFVVTQFQTAGNIDRGVWVSVLDYNGSYAPCGYRTTASEPGVRAPLIVRFRLCMLLPIGFHRALIPNCTASVTV